MMNHAVDQSSCSDGVSEIIAEIFEVDVGRDKSRPFAVASINDFVEQTGVPGLVLFKSVEADFIYKQYFRRSVLF